VAKYDVYLLLAEELKKNPLRPKLVRIFLWNLLMVSGVLKAVQW